MKERPILFSAPMVRAILEGRKTMTRRVIKATLIKHWEGRPDEWRAGLCFIGHAHFNNGPSKQPSPCDFTIQCPYGQTGDRLWVRETFGICDFPGSSTSFGRRKILYRADSETDYDIGKWKPSIFMPRALSRITLEITNVRVERLQDISEGDAKSEGVDAEFEVDLETFMNKQTVFEKLQTFFFGFKHVWKKINGPGSWDANPWVWVIEFKRVEEGK